MGKHWSEYLRRGLKTPPGRIWAWAAGRARRRVHRALAPRRLAGLTAPRLAARFGAASIQALWDRLAARPFPGVVRPVDAAVVERLCPGATAEIRARADAAAARRVDILGSGPVRLGTPVDWQADFKSGHRWDDAPSDAIDVNDLARDSDVKVPWELSRLQWLVPLGQAYLIDGDEARAATARTLIEEWEVANPPGRGVNWTVAMEAAIRAVALVWLFHAFAAARAWRDDEFRFRFLRLLFAHGDFIDANLEFSDVNANHLLADAAGLVVLGGLFGDAGPSGAWRQTGWSILEDEIQKQVGDDGATFEAASAYHRLAAELFLLPALVRRADGVAVSDRYAQRLLGMARFAAAYTRPDGTAPAWGDGDDGRVLPFGNQPIADHRYLVGLIGLAFEDTALIARAAGPANEAFWLLGPDAAARLGGEPTAAVVNSAAFSDAGAYVLASERDHLFVDAGPIGMNGRGGHGHNDALSFEAVLDGAPLIVDSGCYVYTASVEWRNAFRGTAAHNTPMVADEEQNRFVRPDYLWTLHDDARPTVRAWHPAHDQDLIVAAHDGYRRLDPPIVPVRTIRLDKRAHRLIVVDDFEGRGAHRIVVPYHLHPDVEARPMAPNVWRLDAGGRAFLLVWRGEGWRVGARAAFHAPTYGIKRNTTALECVHEGPPTKIAVAFLPADGAPDDPPAWLAAAFEPAR